MSAAVKIGSNDLTSAVKAECLSAAGARDRDRRESTRAIEKSVNDSTAQEVSNDLAGIIDSVGRHGAGGSRHVECG